MMTTVETYHVPVLLKESIDGLGIKPDGVYVDVTFGGGGHSREILRQLGPQGHLYSFDQDEDAERVMGDGRWMTGDTTDMPSSPITRHPSPITHHPVPNFTFVRSNFKYLKNWMRYYGVERIDGLLADLGVSSHHFDDAERGFSFRFDAPLDMRMNKRARYTAADVLASYTEEQLADVFYLYGELKQARRLAAAVVKARTEQPILTTQDLLRVAQPLLKAGDKRPERGEKKDAAKLFQALRIEVNREMVALKQMLLAATELLGEGGRLAVITYHSLEDRMVKNIMKSGNVEGRIKQDFFGRIESPFTLVNNKVITPCDEELERNPRSRSAKLRIGMKNGDGRTTY